ncbi:phosphate regulon transcriptional regulatory protein PhoB [Methylotenera oryzisoli]|jgi:two-component system phosphate regulon response regulator PhoB|uniref:Phosphate regulon transcriptional regulatory protein PhoB n=1 Tax=Methylotenera oryzisoli TaxID=2080758 RepID=A0A4Y9VW31_9PROT|nr:phosphate regulon transcriptional regulator PhoB [Methylotenera oryzisoli]TFW73447.1 phosphate regulon transcriptional regulatory protein PhoB [Methylotenera oryzisoli]
MPANILVIEDEPAIQELLALNITQAGHNAIRALSGEIALDLMRETVPDLILLDWMLPGMNGLELARKLKSDTYTKNIPIIMLTARGEEYDKVRGLEVGADDYVTKPFSPRELNARIKAVLRRRAPQMTDDPIELNGLRLDPTTHRVTGNQKTIDLGPTEFRLLHFFMTNAERVHTRSQLLDKVWGDRVFVEDRTVDVHIRRLRNALSASGHEDLIQTVRGAGYRLSSQPSEASHS